MSAFWNFVTQMVSGTLAKAEDVNTNLSGIDTGFGLVETELNKSIQVANSPGTTDIALNAAARANKLLAFDENGDIAASQILGDWQREHADAAGTDYEIRDVVKDAAGSLGQDNIYICNTTHTSTGSLATDTANWDILVDVAGVAVSAAAALVSENNAATSADFLDDRVLGPLSTANEPTLDNDGNALLTGAQYFNTDLDRMKVYTGTVWQLNTAAAADVTIADAGAIYIATDNEAALQEVKALADAALPEADVDSDIKTLALPANTTISAFIKTLLDDADADAARATLGAAQAAVFANNVNGNPNISDTLFDVDASIAESTWVSVGETGSGATYIWTGLNGVPAGADWVELRFSNQGLSTAETANASRDSAIFIRANGSSEAVNIQNKISGNRGYTNSSGNGGAINIATQKVQISSSVIFDIYWSSTWETATIFIVVVGYGYNP